MARNQFARGKPRQTLWVDMLFTGTTFTASGGTLLVQLSTAGLGGRPVSVRRSPPTYPGFSLVVSSS